jgi:AcrR family transcriptional regulator
MPAAPAPLDDALLSRVHDHLAARDWRLVTVAELAEAAGLSRMTLHRRGVTKEQVLAQLGARLEAEYRDAMFAALTAAGSARERLGAALRAICAVDERYLGVLDALSGGGLDPVFHEPGGAGAPVLTRAAFTAGLRRLLEDGAQDGSIRVADPGETATLLFNAVGHTYGHMRRGHRWPPELACERIVALVLDGLPRR